MLRRLIKVAFIMIATAVNIPLSAGNNGFFGITTSNNISIHLKLKRLSEHDINGHKVDFIPQFENKVYDWSSPVKETCETVPCLVSSTSTELQTKNGNSVNFTIVTQIVSDNVVIPYGNSSVLVPKDSLKFSFNISGWIFKNINNTLELGVRLSGKSYNKRFNKYGTVIYDPVGFLDNPDFAIIDGQIRFIDIDFDSSNNSSHSDIYWSLPSFNNYLYYDPVMGINSALVIQTNYLWIILTILTILSYI